MDQNDGTGNGVRLADSGTEAKQRLAALLDQKRTGLYPTGVLPSEKEILHARVNVDFNYHAPRPDQLPLYEYIRSEARKFAHTLVDSVPAGRELSSALTLLEQAVQTANAGVARHG